MGALDGRTALVTGASSGIGRATALALGGAGAYLALTGRNTQRLEEVAEEVQACGTRASAYAADLTVSADMNSLKFAIDADFGAVDILVHSAGLFAGGSVPELPVDAFREQLEVNVLAPYALTQKFLPALRRRRGDIVFINSRAGMRVARHAVAYSAGKFALRAVADGLRDAVGADGVRVLSVYPGRIATPMQEQVQEWLGNDYDPSRYPQPEEVAACVLGALTLPRSSEVTDLTVKPQQDA